MPKPASRHARFLEQVSNAPDRTTLLYKALDRICASQWIVELYLSTWDEKMSQGMAPTWAGGRICVLIASCTSKRTTSLTSRHALGASAISRRKPLFFDKLGTVSRYSFHALTASDQRTRRAIPVSTRDSFMALIFTGVSSRSTLPAARVGLCKSIATRQLLSYYSDRRFYSEERPTRQNSQHLRSKSDIREVEEGDRSKHNESKKWIGKKTSSESENESLVGSVSKYFHLPQIPHRPTREELLAAATGFWSRMKVRFKWASIRSMRPWNIDEWGAFVSWFLFGHLVWILVGTTTFFSLLIMSINTVFAQETLAKWVGDYLTFSAGITVVFESAIVPRWRDGVISFRNVFVSRRPGQVKSSVSKGSSDDAAAAALQAQDGNETVDDGNYTQFDVTIANVDVTLSFVKWWNGKGLLRDVEVKGVRGVIDRTSVHWSSEGVDPFSYRYEHVPGDFEMESFKLEDLLLTIHQPNGFRPFSVSIYSCELPRLRKQWLFYDFLSANHISGSFDGSLFTIHPRQVHGITSQHDQTALLGIGDASAWDKFSRLRIDGLKIDHLNRGVEGTFGWIYEGNVDIVADVMLPAEADESITKVMAELYDQLEEAVMSNRYRLLYDEREKEKDNEPALLHSGHLSDASSVEDEPASGKSSPAVSIKHAPESSDPLQSEDDRRFLIMDLRIHLNSVKAAVPLFTNELSYVNQALVRPIVAYINANNTYIPITCRIVKRASDFDGSWTIFDCGLMNDMSAETYEAFARDVENQQSRVRRFRKVGFWTLSLAVHALFMGLAGDMV